MPTKDNPNPRAGVGFFAWSAFHYYVYKNIYRHFPDAEFIIGDRRYRDTDFDIGNLGELAEFLNEKKIHWRWYDHTLPRNKREEFFKKYKAVLTVWKSKAFQEEILDEIIKVRVQYGNAKDLWSFGSWNADFDLILCHGRYANQYLGFYTLTEVVGNSLFDDWFNGECDEPLLLKLRSGLDPKKKTILYMPTSDRHPGLGTVSMLLKGGVKRVFNDYNLIIKLHHFLRHDDSSLTDNLRRVTPWVYDERDSSVTLLRTADFVLSDNSGAIFDAVLAGKPIILFKTPTDALKKFEPTVNPRIRKVIGIMMWYNGLVQRIKRGDPAIGPVIESFYEISSAVEEEKNKKADFNKNRERIKKYVFQYHDEFCGKRAADAVMDMIENNFKYKDTYPLFHYVYKRERLLRKANKKLKKEERLAPLGIL